MPTIPDPLIDEVLADPDRYLRRVHTVRRQEAKAWVEDEMERAERRYRERRQYQRLSSRIMRAIKSWKSAA